MSLESIEYNGTRYAEVIWADTQVAQTTFFSPAQSSFQFGLLAHKAGFVEPPHYHKPFSRKIDDLQQMFVVQRGVVVVELYGDDGQMLREISLRQGDAIVLIHGVHAIRVEEDMQCISVKQGPFLGPENDKVFVEVRAVIPVFEPAIGKEEIDAVVAALKRGEISGSFGEAIPQFETSFATYCGVRHGVACTSGTTALHLAVAAVGISPGDEVLVSSSTNIATALAVHHHGATVVPVDVEKDTWNLDLDLVEKLITPKTKAIIPVHLYGHPVDMDRLMEIANRHKLIVIEDAAEAHGATVRGRKVGSFGQMACFSFYANKIITTGEGGMVLTDDDVLADRLRLLRNLGFTTPRFRHDVAGYNFRMTGLQAAMGVAQVAKLDAIVEQKRRVAQAYNDYFAQVPGLRLPVEKKWAKNVYWMYGIALKRDFGISRDELAANLREEGIETRTFFCPMNQQPCLQRRGREMAACPVADRLWTTGLYLPSSIDLPERTIQQICQKIHHSRLKTKRRRAA